MHEIVPTFVSLLEFGLARKIGHFVRLWKLQMGSIEELGEKIGEFKVFLRCSRERNVVCSVRKGEIQRPSFLSELKLQCTKRKSETARVSGRP